MNTLSDRRLRLRRSVAEFVQSTLPLRPEEGGTLADPLAYLLPEEILKKSHIKLTPTGKDLHDAFQNYKQNLDQAVVERLTDKAKLRNLMSGGMCFIQSKSGSGKTFLVARIMATLIHNHKILETEAAPVILFSQLKLALERTMHQTNLTTAILSCMHLQGGEYSRIEDMIYGLGEGVLPDFAAGEPSALLFIDSLDEFEKSQLADLPKVDSELRRWGILPIWSIRQLEFSKLDEAIVGKSPVNLIARDGDDSAGVSITLDLKPEWVTEYLSPILEKRYTPGHQYIVRDLWLRRSLSEYQLLHIPLTNVASGHSKPGREKRFSDIIERLLEAFDDMEKDWSKPKWQEAASGSRSITEDWMKVLTDEMLRGLIRATLALRLVEEMRNKVKVNGARYEDGWARFCSVFASHAAEVLSKGKTLADKIPLEDMADGKIIVRLLRRVGYVVGPEDNPRFTHRDLTAAFVVHAALDLGIDISSEERKLLADSMPRDTMFSPMFGPLTKENSSFEDNRGFHRRTGMVLAQLPPVSNKMGSIGAVELTGIWNGLVVPWAPDYSGEDKFNEGQNRLARNAMQSWEYRRTPMVIRGPPGTGKTWMGVERMLGITRHVSEHAGWVVTLNSTLAKVHKRELEYQHSQGPALQDLSGKHEERTNFLQKRVRVKGLTEILGDLAGDLWGEEKQINAKRLKEFWDNAVDAMPKTSSHQEHRKRLMAYQNRAMYDFRNIMFGLENTVLLDVETWKKESRHHPHSLWNSDLDEPDLKNICTIWHKQIGVQLRNGFVARHSVAGRLLHRILVLRHLTEGESSPDEKELERLGFITGAKGDLNHILSTLKTRLSQYGVAGSIVIDEVQDMTPAEALLITLLCDFDEADAHRVMLAGDEFQTLNGNDFSWGTWVTRSHELAKILLDKIGQVNKEAAHGWHPLKAFTYLKEIDLPPHITQIQRNHPDIAEFFKKAWDWEMAPGRESNDAMKEAKALEKTGNNDSDVEPSEPVVGIFVQTDTHGLGTVGLIANWLKNLGDLGNIAIIVPDNGLRAELVMMIDDSELFLYDPFTIKGLEQDIVIVIGGYGVSNASEFSVLLNVRPENWTKEHHALFDRINRHMLVANSRAKQTHLSVYFEQDAARPISLKQNFTWRQFTLPDSIRYGHDEGSIPTWNLNDVAARLQTENRTRTWFLRSFHQLAQQFNRSQEDDRFAEQIERVQNAWWAKAQASVKSLEAEDYESDPLLELLISIDPEAKVRPNQPAPQLLALFLNQEKTFFVDDAFGRALAEAQSLKDAIQEQMKSNLTNTGHFLEFIKKNRGKGLIPFSKVNDYVVLNKLLQNRRSEAQRAKQLNREHQNALPKNISGWEVEEPRLKQDVAEMIDERICQVAAEYDLVLGREVDDLAVASRLIQTTPFQPVYAEDRISNVGGIRFYLETVMHALGEQRERPGTSPVLEATLQDYIPKLTAEFRKLAKQKTSQSVDSKTRELLGKVANLATVVYPSPSMLENVIDLHVVLESPIAPPENWFRVLIGESKTAAEGRPWLCDATYRKAKSLFRGKERGVRMDMLNAINTTTRYSWESSLEAVAIALDEEVGVRGAEGGIAEGEVVKKAVKCIADIYYRLFILDRPSSIPRIHDKSSQILDQTMVHDLLRASMFSSNQNERIGNTIAELNHLFGNVSAPTKVSVPVEGAILLAGMAILVDVFDQYRSPSSLETVQRRGHGLPALEQDEGYNTALGKIAASFKSKEAKRLFSKIVNAGEPSIDCVRIGELIYEQTTTRGVGSALAGHIWLQICRKIALKTFKQDGADIFAAMTPPEILELEEHGEIIHIDSLSFTWEKNDDAEATSYDWAWAIQPDGQRQKRVSEFLTECLAGGKIPVFINPDLFVGGEVVPRSGIPLKRYVVPLLNFESPTSIDEGGMILLNLNDQDCLAVLDACKDGILDAISAAKDGRPLWSSQVWPKLSERLKESLGIDIQVEEIQISCSPHLRSIEGRGNFVGLGSFLGSLHQYTTRAPEWFDSWIRDEIGFVREDGEMIAFLR